MHEWKVKQMLYHKLNTDHDDDAKNFDVDLSDDVIGNAVKYFTNNNIGYIWPAKSYVVALCYARWLARDYGGRPLEYLDDPDLLYNNDPYFKRYSDDPSTYIQILQQVGGWDFDETLGVVPDVRKYFDLEFNS